MQNDGTILTQNCAVFSEDEAEKSRQKGLCLQNSVIRGRSIQ
jgi:hypothetical protein